MLLLHLIFLQNLLLFISSISVGRGKLQKERQSSMMSLFAVLKSFIKNLMTTKSRECRSALSIEYHSSPYRRMGRHLLFTNWRVTSSEAILPTLPKMAFIDRLNERSVACPSVGLTHISCSQSADFSDNLSTLFSRHFYRKSLAYKTRHYTLKSQCA